MNSLLNSFAPRPTLSVEAAYDLSAPFYDNWKWQRFWRESEAPAVLEHLKNFVRTREKPTTLLDIGCGTGWYIGSTETEFARCVGIDVSAGMLAIAQSRAPQSEFLKSSLDSMPFDRPCFDAILCTRVISHIEHVGSSLHLIASALRPGGILILSSIDADHDYDLTKLPAGSSHVFVETFKHSRRSIETALASDGLERIKAQLIATDGTVENLTPRLPGRTIPPVAWLSVWRCSR